MFNFLNFLDVDFYSLNKEIFSILYDCLYNKYKTFFKKCIDFSVNVLYNK